MRSYAIHVSLGFLDRPLKEIRFETSDGSGFQEENSILYSGTFKGLSASTTLFGKRKFC
jgi:hypothetical protein